MTRPKVFISEPINPKGIDLLKDAVELVHSPDTTKTTALKLIGDCDAAILRATTIFDAEVIEAAEKLKVIARTGVGYNNVDLETAAKKGIYVTLTPDCNHTTVAEHVLAMILALAKQVFFMDAAVREGKWAARFSPHQMDIAGKTVGIIGLGSIGLEVAERCRAMGMKLLAYDPFYKGNFDGKMTDVLDELFAQSDFVTLHCPVLPSTEKMINKATLAQMKSTAYLINSSRGALIDEDALVEALQNETIKGAALDVFQEEPLSDNHPLATLSNVILSPHCAGSTIESNERIAVMAAQAVLDTLAGKKPKHICNEELLKI
ncbi:hydroxyacid dehydrogenase [Maribacter sp. 2210JD10-5]|uniref:hydroxyacid dehydrogenase n=1 Tax=Maribacter sp. 2210JD10-5 TaxID=3386272 RepID=UPI0039BD61F5